MLPARLMPSTSPTRHEWSLSSHTLKVLTGICGHDPEWQPSPEHATSRQSRQDEPATCVLERIMQVRALSHSEAIPRIPVQKHLHPNDGTGDRGLQNASCMRSSTCDNRTYGRDCIASPSLRLRWTRHDR